MNINQFLSDKITPPYEKKSFCIILAIGFVVALISSFIFWNIYVIPSGTEQGVVEVPMNNIATQVENNPEIQQDAALPERVFTGVLMSTAPDTSFVRISIKDEGVYSVALTPETKITMNDLDADIKTFKPMSTVSVVAFVLPDTEAYDFSARSVVGIRGTSATTVATTSTEVVGPSVAGAPVATPSINTSRQGLSTQEKLEELIKESSEDGMIKR